MSLNGRIRELGLGEVGQLLAMGRKSGTLRLRAPVDGLAAEIVFQQGGVTHAARWKLAGEEEPEDEAVCRHGGYVSREVLEATVLEVLTWSDGEFRFVAAPVTEEPTPATRSRMAPSLRIPIEPLLIEAARRADLWRGVVDRIPHAGVIPAFPDVEPHALPLLRLAPQDWEVLTQVDGARDIRELAAALGRDLFDVLPIVHSLLGTGLLTLHGGAASPENSPESTFDPDLWNPGDRSDLVFDPLNDPSFGAAMSAPHVRSGERSFAEESVDSVGVASALGQPSMPQDSTSKYEPVARTLSDGERGDDAARRGDLQAAILHWRSALTAHAATAEYLAPAAVDRLREAIALATRLQTLLHPA